MKLFRCSECEQLEYDPDLDICYCPWCNATPGQRDKDDKKQCKKMFAQIDKPWHEKLRWEK